MPKLSVKAALTHHPGVKGFSWGGKEVIHPNPPTRTIRADPGRTRRLTRHPAGPERIQNQGEGRPIPRREGALDSTGFLEPIQDEGHLESPGLHPRHTDSAGP